MAGRHIRRLRWASILPFTAGVSLGSLITLFLILTLRSIEDEPRDSAVDLSRQTGASVRMPSLPLQRVGNTEHRGAAMVTPRARETASYAIIISREQLRARGLAAHRTWAGHLGKRARFYVFPPALDEDIEFAMQKRIPLASLQSKTQARQLRGRQGRRDRVDAPSANSVLKALLDVCEKELGSYHWYVKVADTTYVRSGHLEAVLSALNSSEPHLIGHRVSPERQEGEELGLLQGESFCMEMGYAISFKALELLCPMLRFCQENARSENEDVEVARCIRLTSGVNCTGAAETRAMFYKAQSLLAEEELQLGDHRLNPSMHRGIMFNPLTHPEHFYSLHYYHVKKQLNDTRSAAMKLRMRMVDAADHAVESDRMVRSSNMHESPSWTKLGVKSPYRPSTVDNVIHCQSFDSDYRYTEAEHYPSHPLSSLAAAGLKTVISAASEKTGQNNLLIDGVLQRVDPQRGIDYFLHALSKNTEGDYESIFMHALRETEPLKIASMDNANYKTSKVNFIVPAPAASKAFQRFMMSYENSFLARTPPEMVGLMVILYTNGKIRTYSKNLYGTTTLLNLYKKKYPEADLRILSTNKPFSRKESIELASKEYSSFELLFLADIHVDFSLQFLQRCRLNAIENQQAYFPAVFSPYDPSNFYKFRVMHPYAIRFQISDSQGTWMHENYHLACMLNYDLTRIVELGRDQSEKEWSLIGLVLKYHQLDVFRAVEPGLVHLWQDGCEEEEEEEQQEKDGVEVEEEVRRKERMLCKRLELSGTSVARP